MPRQEKSADTDYVVFPDGTNMLLNLKQEILGPDGSYYAAVWGPTAGGDGVSVVLYDGAHIMSVPIHNIIAFQSCPQRPTDPSIMIMGEIPSEVVSDA
jgi:hypothetical protein